VPRFYVEHLAIDFWRGGRIFKPTKKRKEKGFKKRGTRKASPKKDPG
jgi:hypothetical protein